MTWAYCKKIWQNERWRNRRWIFWYDRFSCFHFCFMSSLVGSSSIPNRNVSFLPSNLFLAQSKAKTWDEGRWHHLPGAHWRGSSCGGGPTTPALISSPRSSGSWTKMGPWASHAGFGLHMSFDRMNGRISFGSAPKATSQWRAWGQSINGFMRGFGLANQLVHGEGCWTSTCLGKTVDLPDLQVLGLYHPSSLYNTSS